MTRRRTLHAKRPVRIDGKSIAEYMLRETGPRFAPDDHRRDAYRIVIVPGLWRGFDIAIEPPTSTHPLRHFRTHAEAMAFAQELARTESWPLRDLIKEGRS